MKRLLVFVLGCFCFAHTADDLDKLTYVLKKMADEAELFKPGTGASKLRIIVQSDDYNVFDGTQLLAQVQKINDEAGGKIIKGVPELVRFDPEKSTPLWDLKLSEYKTIFVAGWKPRFDKEAKQCFDRLNFFQPYLHAYTGDQRNFFNGYGATFKHEDAVLVVLACLDNVFGDADMLDETVEMKLQQWIENQYTACYGTVTLSDSVSPTAELKVFAVQDEKKSSYPGGLAAWLKKPLPQKSVVENLEKTEQERLALEKKTGAEAAKEWEKNRAEAKLKEEKIKKEYEDKLTKAKAFRYEKLPKVRLIATDIGGVSAAVANFLNSQNSGNKLFEGTPVIAKYQPTETLEQLDGEYKNIFVFRWNTDEKKSTLFLRSDGYFAAYAKVDEDKFSPVASLVLFVPQNDEAKGKIKNDYVGSFSKNYCKGMGFDSCGGKPVSVGYLMQDGGSAETKIYGLEGVTTLVDWLKYGVK